MLVKSATLNKISAEYHAVVKEKPMKPILWFSYQMLANFISEIMAALWN